MSEDREDGERGEREGEDTQALSLSSGTHRIHNSLTEDSDRLPVVELREPRNMCVCVNEERGHGEGVGAHGGGCGCACYSANRYTKENRQSRRKFRQNDWG